MHKVFRLKADSMRFYEGFNRRCYHAMKRQRSSYMYVYVRARSGIGVKEQRQWILWMPDGRGTCSVVRGHCAQMGRLQDASQILKSLALRKPQ